MVFIRKHRSQEVNASLYHDYDFLFFFFFFFVVVFILSLLSGVFVTQQRRKFDIYCSIFDCSARDQHTNE